MAQSESLRIHEGTAWAFFAFDAGHSIELDAAQRLLRSAPGDEESHRTAISHRRRAPGYLQFRPAPLQVDQSVGDLSGIDLAGLVPAPRVECTLYDFGAISVAYQIPFAQADGGVSIDSLVPLARALGEHSDLAADAKKRVHRLAERLAKAIDRAAVVDLVEDYTVYHVRSWSPASDVCGAVAAARSDIARLLLAEPGPLSDEAVDAVHASHVSYAPQDIAIVDWNAALLLDAQAEDSLAVLEFANVELLEMRFIDDRLDSILDKSYASLLHRETKNRFPHWPFHLLLDPNRAERRRLSALQMESAILFENINNTLKLVGDQHLARLYALAAKRLHLADWDQSILRKLHTIDGMYQKLADEQSGRRMEFLEWIVIVLILFEIVLPLFSHRAH